MNLYLISQDLVVGCETYDSAVVAAESEDDARAIHPWDKIACLDGSKWVQLWRGEWSDSCEEVGWVKYSDIDRVTVEFLGETDKERGVILASYNAR